MSFFSFLLPIGVKSMDGKISIENIKSRDILENLCKSQGSTRVINNIFFVKSSSLTFYEFFLPEVFQMCNKAIDSKSTGIQTKSKFKAIVVKLKENTWLDKVDEPCKPRLDLDRLSNITYAPLPHQVEFMDYYSNELPKLGLNGMLMAFAPGMAKTSTSIMISECLNAPRVIVISPLVAVVKVWEDNILKCYKKPQSYWLSTYKESYNNQRYAVYHYEAIGKALEDIHKLKTDNTVVVLDECHNLAEIKSLRTQLFLELVKQLNCKNILFLSGTPVKDVSLNLLPFFRAVDPLFTPKVEEQFKKAFAGSATEANKMMNARLGKMSFKVDKSRSGLDKPVITDVPVTISNGDKYTLPEIKKVMEAFVKERNEYYKKREPEDRKFYDYCLNKYEQTYSRDKIKLAELAKYRDCVKCIQEAYRNLDLQNAKGELEYAKKFENSNIGPLLTSEEKVRFKDVKSVIKYVGLKIQGECLGRILGRFRIDAHVDMVKYINFKAIIDDAEKKTVIFSTYVEVLEESMKILRNLGYKPLGVYGQYTKDLSNIVGRFGKEEDINPLVATYASLSTAVPLVMANTVIMINSPFRAYIQDQAISRVHRLGNDTPTYIYQTYLDTGEHMNISTRSQAILQITSQMVQEITGMKNPYLEATAVDDEGGYTIANEALDLREEHQQYIQPRILVTEW